MIFTCLDVLIQYLQSLFAYATVYNVRKEMKCSGDSEILHELVRDNTQKSEKLKLIREVS